MSPTTLPPVRLGVVAVLLASTSAQAEKLLAHEDVTINVGALLQPQALVAQDAAPDGGAGTDFFLRRARLMLHGDLSKRVSFFVDTEQVNLGKDGNWETSIYVQDAFASLRVSPEASPGAFIDAGMILVPFTRHSMQSAVSLNGLDYHARLILYPSQSTRIWRDVGIQGRANLGPVQLRAGVFNGVEGTAGDGATVMERNPDDLPRLAGHARVALVGEEKGFFYPGMQFSDTPVLSMGVGVDWQRQAVAVTGMTEAADHLALAADVYLHLPTGPDQALVAQATAVRYDDGDVATSTGYGGFVELGFRFGRFEPIVAFDRFNSQRAAGDHTGFHLGGAAFLDQHRTNLKLDVARLRNGATEASWSATLQGQLSF